MFANRVISQLLHKVNPNVYLNLGLDSNSSMLSSSFSIGKFCKLTTQSQPSPISDVDCTMKSTVKPYPFSLNVVVSPKPIPYDSKLGLMGNVEKKLISTGVNQEFYNLFRKNHPESIRPLSIIKVESYTNQARTSTNLFTGVLMAVRRRGTETSFRLRTILDKVGVEMKFNVFSPIIKNITIIKKAGDTSSGLINGKPMIKKPRRAKLFYLRDHPEKMPDIRKISKSVLTAQIREEQK